LGFKLLKAQPNFLYVALLSGVIFTFAARSKKIYQSFVQNKEEEYAIKAIRNLKICGIIQLFFSIFWLIFYLSEKNI
jgi:hypothetical protein